MSFVDYNVPPRTELLPEHIKGTSTFFEEDGRYFVEIKNNFKGVEFINGHWYFIHWSHRKECWTVNPAQDHINDPRVYQLGTKDHPWGRKPESESNEESHEGTKTPTTSSGPKSILPSPIQELLP